MIERQGIVAIFLMLLAEGSTSYYFDDGHDFEVDEVDHGHFYQFEHVPRHVHVHEFKFPEAKPPPPVIKHYGYNHHYHHHLHHHAYEHKHHEHKPKEHKKEHHSDKHEDHDHHHKGPPRYEFKYGVRDPNTGDIKKQWEVRKGDRVLGEYSLVEADGSIRTVSYTADKKNGFNAVVKTHGKAIPSLQVSAPVRKRQTPRTRRVERVRESTTKVPVNHKPVFSRLEDSNRIADPEPEYGVEEYLSKRSYDMNRISEMLNVNGAPSRTSRDEFDHVRAVRGTFVMGR